MSLMLESPAFEPNGRIPAQYTADGDDRSPPLQWSGVPEEAKTLALVVQDPDAPSGTFVHWVAFNIPATLDHLPDGRQHRGDYTDGTLQGQNDFERVGYGGPRPPAGQSHRYVFKFYALDDRLNLEPGVSCGELERAMQGHVLDSTELIGHYARA